MKVIIDIPQGLKIDFENENWTALTCAEMKNALINGTLLPKVHGRLIDADYLKDVILLHNFHGNNKNIVPYADRRGYRLRQREVDEAIINAPTIIEADMRGKS